MKEIYGAALKLLANGQPFALATIVRSRGSTPQRAGSHAIFYADGRTDGNLGGGCLEMEARRRALDALQTNQPEFFPLHLNSDFGFDDGLICGGTADILVEPMSDRHADAFRAAADAVHQKVDAAVATVIDSPDPEQIGARAVVVTGESPQVVIEMDAGSLSGTLAELAHAAANRTIPTPAVSNLEGCTLFVEALLRPPTLLVVGAGHVGMALSRLASGLDFLVSVLDDRPSFADSERLPWADRVLLGDIPTMLREMDLPPDSYVVIVTRGHRHDGAALRECLGRPLAYLGMIGSRRKIKMVFDELLEEQQTTPDELNRIRSPLGLDIGAQSVEEIAVSIAAELVMVRRAGAHPPTGRPLSELRKLV